MSLPNEGRKVRSITGKHIPDEVRNMALAGGLDFGTAISVTLREVYGGSSASIKAVMAHSGAGERAVRNWFEGMNAPNGSNLVELVRHSDAVLEVFLLMAGRADILTHKSLVDAREQLQHIVELVDKLLVYLGSDEESD